MTKEPSTILGRADRLGIVASAACLVHCVVTPVALSLSAVWAHNLPSEERFHRLFAVLIAAIGAFAIVGGYRRHRRRRALALMGAGLAFIFAGAYWGDRLLLTWPKSRSLWWAAR